MAQALVRAGCDVVFCDIDVAAAGVAVAEVAFKPGCGKALAMPCDITSLADCERAVAECARLFGGLDIVVNNAGKQQNVDALEDISDEEFDLTFKTNVYAMFWITKAALPHLKPGSSIINTSSIQAYAPSPNLVHYATT